MAKKFEVEQMKTDQLVKDLKNLIPAETLANLSLNPTETNPIGYDRAEDMRKAKEFLMITVDSLNVSLLSALKYSLGTEMNRLILRPD